MTSKRTWPQRQLPLSGRSAMAGSLGRGQGRAEDPQPVPALDRVEPLAVVAALSEGVDERRILVGPREAFDAEARLAVGETVRAETTWSTKSAPRPTCSMPITETAWSRWSTQRESVGVSGSMKNRIAITPSTPPRSASASSCQSARFLGWSKTARQPACVTENGTPSSMTSRQVCSDACARSRTTPSSANRRTSVRPRSLSPCSGVSMPPANSFWIVPGQARRADSALPPVLECARDRPRAPRRLPSRA